jgi:predicted acetyltransferase
MTSPAPALTIRTLTPELWDAFVEVNGHAFGSTPDQDMLTAEREVLEDARSLAAFDGEQMVGIASAYSFDLAVPGGVTPAAGVTWVGVLPTYRRRGVLRALMTHQLGQVREAGREPIAILWASEPSIYGRFGYGRATHRLSLSVPRNAHALLPDSPTDPRLRLRLVPAQDWQLVADVYAAEARRRPGLVERDDRWHRNAVRDVPSNRNGRSELRCVVAEDESGIRGYARYSTKPDWSQGFPAGDVDVRELIASDVAARAALYRYLFDLDLMGTTALWNLPADDPVQHWLADARRTHASLSDSLYTRVVDLPAAVAARTYSTPLDLVLDVQDALLTGNTGRWRLTAADDGKARCERTEDSADLTLSVTGLGAVFLGGTRLVDLAEAALVQEHTAGAVGAMSRAFATSPQPWSPAVF